MVRDFGPAFKRPANLYSVEPAPPTHEPSAREREPRIRLRRSAGGASR